MEDSEYYKNNREYRDIKLNNKGDRTFSRKFKAVFLHPIWGGAHLYVSIYNCKEANLKKPQI